MISRLTSLFSGLRASAPFEFAELVAPDQGAVRLFADSFGTPPPNFPFHFVARHPPAGRVVGYVHYTEHLPGVYLCGGLCVDRAIYRRLSSGERDVVRQRGSLSRWLLNESIERLRQKSAVFAYTGNVMSIRDGLASGFVETDHPHLIAQWHSASEPERPGLIEQVCRLGPF